MNVHMWEHPSTKENIAKLTERGTLLIGPDQGDMACGEFGFGRMSEPVFIAEKINNIITKNPDLQLNHLNNKLGKLVGHKAIVTSGPTYEAIDPVRYLANYSSGQQGHAIAKALAKQGAETILVSGPTQLPDPKGVTVIPVTSAKEMFAACKAALPADIVICAAAVADWRIKNPTANKIKKNGSLPTLKLTENPDILWELSKAKKNRPRIVIGFAAETTNVISHAQAKLQKKGCDWIIANDVSKEVGTFGSHYNTVHIISKDGIEAWPTLTKDDISHKLSIKVANFLENSK